ncbi:glycosyltransferase [Clostridium neonatale]|uniref:glycosyltransferase n=1 Tax=Clostridium neonatale TaxID=137838 RepID=UPI003D34C5C6
MDNKKIAFIITSSNDEIYKNQIKYINNLYVPNGYTVDIIKIDNKKEGTNVVENYNIIMQKNNAKFKVYLDENITIINKNFIKKVLDIFNKDKKIGVIGIKGSKKLPASVTFDHSLQKYGKIYSCTNGSMKCQSYNEAIGDYEKVQVIYGGIFVTQYDVDWRSDIFASTYFSCVAQCLEFETLGYKTVVPKQNEPWCIDDSKNNFNEEEYKLEKETFLKQYSKKVFPLVSILIPTYNRPEYFELALQSVLNQTYKNIEIIIGDDSTNNDTEKLINYYINNYDNINYYHNQKNLGQFDNDIKLYNMAKGEFINYLMDDDLFKEEKIEKMMNYFIQDNNKEISIVTSNRAIIDEYGTKKEVFREMDEYFKEDSIIPGISLGNFMLKTNCNCIGEPTTTLFRKDKLYEPFGTFNERKYGCNVDQASWLNLLKEGNCVYIAEILSYFRIHDEQQQCSDNMKLLGALDYSHSILIARLKGFLKEEEEYFKALKKGLQYSKLIYCEINNSEDKDKFGLEIQQLKQNCELMQNEFCNLRKDNEHHTENKLPLVSILIPAYNQTKYLKDALISAIKQTYENIEIIIGDDSTTDEVEKFIQPYLEMYDNIVYFKNDTHDMDYGLSNGQRLLEASTGEYVNFLFHDDIFATNKIEKMMEYFEKNDNLTIVTSIRQVIDSRGNKLPLDGAFKPLVYKDTVISGYNMNKYMVTHMINCIGEPTVVLFKKKYLDNKFGRFNEIKFECNVDIAMWAQLLQYGDIVYIAEPLSYFRRHEEQNSNKADINIRGVIDFYYYARECYNCGIIESHLEYKSILNKWIVMLGNTLIKLNKSLINENFDLRVLKDVYMEVSDELFKTKVKHKKCIICGSQVERFLPYQYKLHKKDYANKYDVIGSDVENFSCPYCLSHDRERHLIMYFNRLNIWKYIINKTILHIAPEKNIQNIINNLTTKKYICGDLYPNNNSIEKIDITHIKYEDNYFDFIMCNHVLEHILDDTKAMSELYRVLKKGGYAVLQTPYSPRLGISFEDTNINTAEERKIYYGQSDHVRIYGLDIFERIKSVGFIVEIVENSKLFTVEECIEYGVNYKENLILVKK